MPVHGIIIKSASTSVWKWPDWSWPSSVWIHQYVIGPRPFQLCYQKTGNLDGLCRTRTADRPVPLRISKGRQYHTSGPLDQSATPSDQARGPIYHTRGPVGPSRVPIGPQDYHTGPEKGPIGPVCDIIKQGISSTFRDSESSTTSKFIYVFRLGITPLMLKSFISSVQLVNSLF
jgi:hypothetical protein